MQLTLTKTYDDQTAIDLIQSVAIFPGFAKLYLINAEKYVQKRIERGTPLTQKTGKEYFDWWINDRK
jgi:hypothetical protein